jgi:hypothetical protein
VEGGFSLGRMTSWAAEGFATQTAIAMQGGTACPGDAAPGCQRNPAEGTVNYRSVPLRSCPQPRNPRCGSHGSAAGSEPTSAPVVVLTATRPGHTLKAGGSTVAPHNVDPASCSV